MRKSEGLSLWVLTSLVLKWYAHTRVTPNVKGEQVGWSILCALWNAIGWRRSSKRKKQEKEKKSKCNKWKPRGRKERGRMWTYDSALDNCLKCHLFAQAKSKISSRYFGRNLNIFKTLVMIYQI